MTTTHSPASTALAFCGLRAASTALPSSLCRPTAARAVHGAGPGRDRRFGRSPTVAGMDSTSARSRPGADRTTPVRDSSTRDAQRARVYRAEDAWAARLDAARLGAPLAVVAGSRLLLPAERRLGGLDAARGYLRDVLTLEHVRGAVGEVPPPLLRSRRGARAAHWEPPGTIAVSVPRHGEPWALRETVLLHELAHHVGAVTGLARGHRAPFPALLLLLVEAVLGDEAAFALRVDYGTERVEVGTLPALSGCRP